MKRAIALIAVILLALLAAPAFAQRPEDPFLISPEGIGLVKLGMTKQQVEAVMGCPDRVNTDNLGHDFYTYDLKGHPYLYQLLRDSNFDFPIRMIVWFMQAEKVEDIEIDSDPRFHTRDDLSAGASKERVMMVMGNQIDHRYPDAFLLYQWIKFLFVDGRVSTVEVFTPRVLTCYLRDTPCQ